MQPGKHFLGPTRPSIGFTGGRLSARGSLWLSEDTAQAPCSRGPSGGWLQGAAGPGLQPVPEPPVAPTQGCLISWVRGGAQCGRQASASPQPVHRPGSSVCDASPPEPRRGMGGERPSRHVPPVLHLPLWCSHVPCVFFSANGREKASFGQDGASRTGMSLGSECFPCFCIKGLRCVASTPLEPALSWPAWALPLCPQCRRATRGTAIQSP